MNANPEICWNDKVKGSSLKVIRLLDKALLILIQNYGSREAQSILSKLKMVPKKLFEIHFWSMNAQETVKN